MASGTCDTCQPTITLLNFARLYTHAPSVPKFPIAQSRTRERKTLTLSHARTLLPRLPVRPDPPSPAYGGFFGSRSPDICFIFLKRRRTSAPAAGKLRAEAIGNGKGFFGQDGTCWVVLRVSFNGR
ncbi:hypothetical protein PanWU01x14_276920 [Parasponia andersonii]|uniref:Uncharacterized protein n=1 Tax=Parasponia andersonii TaxID=3476 RepID=A0A2P5B2R2_PARAD|nr:hypothetical protein PanWU01x14_276920 [Parasponia andersonii]